eukprot:comp15575_c0_seq1/m.12670 comp15575_c0_seq1/g.12670  ORF comp15575_c0_seq1/g.12670 comp15575_c0_seq1/m.12670 type:complete len:583 (-) comp15575_c0_seq1:608-2356(-)
MEPSGYDSRDYDPPHPTVGHQRPNPYADRAGGYHDEPVGYREDIPWEGKVYGDHRERRRQSGPYQSHHSPSHGGHRLEWPHSRPRGYGEMEEGQHPFASHFEGGYGRQYYSRGSYQYDDLPPSRSRDSHVTTHRQSLTRHHAEYSAGMHRDPRHWVKESPRMDVDIHTMRYQTYYSEHATHSPYPLSGPSPLGSVHGSVHSDGQGGAMVDRYRVGLSVTRSASSPPSLHELMNGPHSRSSMQQSATGELEKTPNGVSLKVQKAAARAQEGGGLLMPKQEPGGNEYPEDDRRRYRPPPPHTSEMRPAQIGCLSAPRRTVLNTFYPRDAAPSVLKAPTITTFHGPLVPPAEQVEVENAGKRLGDSKGPSCEFNYHLAMFDLRHYLSRVLSDGEVDEFEDLLRCSEELHMEGYNYLDFKDFVYLEDTYKRQADFLSVFLDLLVVPGVVVRMTGNILAANRCFCELLDMRPAETKGANIVKMLSPSYLMEFIRALFIKLNPPGATKQVFMDLALQRRNTQDSAPMRATVTRMSDIYSFRGVYVIIFLPFHAQNSGHTDGLTVFPPMPSSRGTPQITKVPKSPPGLT